MNLPFPNTGQSWPWNLYGAMYFNAEMRRRRMGQRAIIALAIVWKKKR